MFKNVKGYTLPAAVSIRTRQVRKFDQANLVPSQLPAWYRALKEKEKEKEKERLMKEAEMKIGEKRKNRGKRSNKKMITHFLKRMLYREGSMTSLQLLEKVKGWCAEMQTMTRTKLLKVLRALVLAKKIAIRVDPKNPKNFLYRIKKEDLPIRLQLAWAVKKSVDESKIEETPNETVKGNENLKGNKPLKKGALRNKETPKKVVEGKEVQLEPKVEKSKVGTKNVAQTKSL